MSPCEKYGGKGRYKSSCRHLSEWKFQDCFSYLFSADFTHWYFARSLESEFELCWLSIIANILSDSHFINSLRFEFLRFPLTIFENNVARLTLRTSKNYPLVKNYKPVSHELFIFWHVQFFFSVFLRLTAHSFIHLLTIFLRDVFFSNIRYFYNNR